MRATNETQTNETILSPLSRLLDHAFHQAPTLKALQARLLRGGLIALSSTSLHPFPWNAAIAALSHRGLPSLAVLTFSLMHRLALPLDSYALCSALAAATASMQPVGFGRQVHACVSKSGWTSSIFVGGALIDFYAKSSASKDACKVFDEMPVRNVICANALLGGYAESKQWAEGIALCRGLHGMGIEPDAFTLSAVLRICAEGADVRSGLQVHCRFLRRTSFLDCDVFLQSSLVEMYARCGLVDKARMVFESASGAVGTRGRDVVLWTSMLNAYGRNGRFDDVIKAFEEMLDEGTEPDDVVFLAVLSACSHTGHVTRGLGHFESMRRDYGVDPSLEHHGCVVDMLCRAGDLEKAWKVANEMALKMEDGGGSSFGVSMWGSLLSACRDWGNASIGKVAAQKALELDPGNAGIYIELSNLYARVGMWDEIREVRELMEKTGLKKDLGTSWLELKK